MPFQGLESGFHCLVCRGEGGGGGGGLLPFPHLSMTVVAGVGQGGHTWGLHSGVVCVPRGGGGGAMSQGRHTTAQGHGGRHTTHDRRYRGWTRPGPQAQGVQWPRAAHARAKADAHPWTARLHGGGSGDAPQGMWRGPGTCRGLWRGRAV